MSSRPRPSRRKIRPQLPAGKNLDAALLAIGDTLSLPVVKGLARLETKGSFRVIHVPPVLNDLLKGHSRIVHDSGLASRTLDKVVAIVRGMSKKVDTDFPDRLREAARKNKVPYSQQPIASFLGVDRRNVDVWMKGSLPRADIIFEHADKWGVDPRWYATGEGGMDRQAKPEGLDPAAEDLLERYQAADPRWQVAIRFIAYVSGEDQLEVASDVNMVLAKAFGKRPGQIRYASNRSVERAFGEAPHVAARKKKEVKP